MRLLVIELRATFSYFTAAGAYLQLSSQLNNTHIFTYFNFSEFCPSSDTLKYTLAAVLWSNLK